MSGGWALGVELTDCLLCGLIALKEGLFSNLIGFWSNKTNALIVGSFVKRADAF